MLAFLTEKEMLLRETDPDRIYVENVRSFFHLPRKVARFLCEMAVRDRKFDKRYAINCPNCGQILADYERKEDIPDQISCIVCEVDEKEEFTFDTKNLPIVEFYKLRR